jgi:hypothetical protein
MTSQVNGSLCMLDYINNYFAIFTLWVAMGIEFSGLLHSSYLIQMLVAKLAGQTIECNEEPRNAAQNVFFWFRCLMSLAILCFCFAVTLVALFNGQTTMWDGIPEAVGVIIFFLLMPLSVCLKVCRLPSLLSPRFPSLNEEMPYSPRRPATSPIQRQRPEPSGLYDWSTALCCIVHVLHRSGHYYSRHC